VNSEIMSYVEVNIKPAEKRHKVPKKQAEKNVQTAVRINCEVIVRKNSLNVCLNPSHTYMTPCFSADHRMKTAPSIQQITADPRVTTTRSHRFTKADRVADELVFVGGAGIPVVVTPGWVPPADTCTDAEGEGKGEVAEMALLEEDDPDPLTLAADVALALADGTLTVVPELNKPLPTVLKGTQLEDAGAGCAAGVAGCPWKKVEVP